VSASTSSELRIVPAEENQLPLVLSFIRKLAEYERLSHEVVADEESLRRSLFGPNRAAEVVFACIGDQPVGYAVYFQTFSTFSGGRGIYLEDLFVEPAHRSKGVGKAVLSYLARLAKERDCVQLNWAVLDWNQPAIDFYRKLGATPREEWTVFRLAGEALESLARQEQTVTSEGLV